MSLDRMPSDDAPIRTLLRTAATARPVDEVAALVGGSVLMRRRRTAGTANDS
ncbi:hypothetical protein [Streptomyces sp. NPDC051662]|uniref:hypothetical protein n=1 Tax=Streptomyces sp. NPDC051662 TaxID=3154750 RepID=UPI003438237B